MSESEELPDTPPPGTVLAGKYRVNRLLGHGGMGYVLAATHLQLDEPVAIKFLHSSHLGDSDVTARFLREAKAVRKIRSEHVARVLDVGSLEDGAPYIVMEFLEGTDLDGLLKKTGRQPIASAVDVILQASEALAEAHCLGMVHRDLKPANLFVAKRADGHDLVKVLDFGISKVAATANEAALTKAGTMLGSPLYMAPEQIRSFSGVDPRTDIWALATILHECLVGTPPFDGISLPELCMRILDEPAAPMRGRRPEIPEALEKVIHRCLAKDPSERYANVAELANALAPFASDFGRQSVGTIAGVFATAGIEVARPSSPPATSPTPALVMPSPTPKVRVRTLFDPGLASPRPVIGASKPASATNPLSAPLPSSTRQAPSTQNPATVAAISQPGLAPRPVVGASTTGKAWGPPRASSPPPIAAPKKRESNSDALMIGAVVAGLIVLGLVALLVVPAVMERRATAKATPEVVPLPSDSVSPAPSGVHDASPTPLAPSAVVEPAAVEPAIVDAGVALANVDAAVVDAARPVSAPAPVKVDCTHPFEFDPNGGRKRWKPECVH